MQQEVASINYKKQKKKEKKIRLLVLCIKIIESTSVSSQFLLNSEFNPRWVSHTFAIISKFAAEQRKR